MVIGGCEPGTNYGRNYLQRGACFEGDLQNMNLEHVSVEMILSVVICIVLPLYNC